MTLSTTRPRAFRGLLAFAETELRVQLHEEAAILTSMVVQVVLLIFVSILAPSLLGVALVGAIVFSFFALGQRVLNEAAFIRVDHRLNELYLASPLAPESYFFGLSLGVMVAYLAPILLVALAAELVVHFTLVSAVTIVLSVVAVWLFSCSIGYIVSTLFRDMRAIWPWASLLYNLFGVLPPVFYPITSAPVAIRWISLFLPPSAATALINETITPANLTGLQIFLAAASLAVEAALVFLFAIYWARRSVREE
ncbi:MAG: ABC transporter permease [Thermoplasmata archaeon]|nr:ABC transporter permease [Thermoplasmata archaeon]